MAVSIADIKEIRELTGAGMLDVKKALEEAEGDKKRALELIRLKFKKSADKRSDRSTAEGLVVAKSVKGGEGEIGYILELNCETDFVAKSDKFIELADTLIDAIIAADASNAEEALKAKTAEGTVADTVIEKGAALGEKVALGKVARITAPALSLYTHTTAQGLPPAIAVFVATDEKGQAAGHNIAIHVTAYAPQYINRDEVPADVIADEERLAKEANAGKPENIMPKIIEGKLNAYYKENVLVDQAIATDPSGSKTVGQEVAATGGKLIGFLRVQVGA